ncbi:MAG TPA: serine/threonine-protein kinase [Ktedonobacterales bacterium]|nr:serine/threonine-protein kinase [Ktedonobacterales bacterium]
MNETTTSGSNRVGVGDRLTDYSSFDVAVQRPVSGGGFGLVYFGPCRLHGNRWFALKTLRPDVLARSERASDLFVREGLTWVGLWPHANLLTAQSVTLINGQPFLVLDYAEHGSLRDLFATLRRRKEWLPPLTALILAQNIASGLVALHTPDLAFLRPQPLVHRDLKPENILIATDGYAKITDFGIAKVFEGLSDDGPTLLGLLDRLGDPPVPPGEDSFVTADGEHEQPEGQAFTQERGAMGAVQAGGAPITAAEAMRSRRYQTARGVALGTPAYMAPEQWEDAALAGPPADVYAFGLLLAELFTGYYALLDLNQPQSVDEWRMAHREGAPRPLATLAQRATADARLSTEQQAALMAAVATVEGIYQACLAKEVGARPTAVEALVALQRAAVALGATPYTPPDLYPHTSEHERIKWHNWAITYFNFGLYAEALQRNDRALALASADPGALLNRGNILAELDRREEALEAYDRALAALPPDDRLRRKGLWNNRGVLLGELRRYAEADVAFSQALTLAPDAADTWFNQASNLLIWGRAEAQSGRIDAGRERFHHALTAAERAIALNPHNPQSQRVLTTIREALRTLGKGDEGGC